jgi:hypothetical protein
MRFVRLRVLVSPSVARRKPWRIQLGALLCISSSPASTIPDRSIFFSFLPGGAGLLFMATGDSLADGPGDGAGSPVPGAGAGDGAALPVLGAGVGAGVGTLGLQPETAASINVEALTIAMAARTA